MDHLLVGLGSATACNDMILFPVLSLHALWHELSAFGFMTLWAFNDVRFRKAAGGLSAGMTRFSRCD